MIKTLSFGFGLALASAGKAFANPACPICTIAVGASLGVARKLGVDDNIVGLWAGALLALLGYWLIIWFDKKNWQFKGRNFILITLSISMIGFMYLKELTYTPVVIMYVFYMDPFLFCTLMGALILVYSSAFYQWMKKRNGGHAHFPFEKVIIPVLALVLASVYLQYFPI